LNLLTQAHVRHTNTPEVEAIDHNPFSGWQLKLNRVANYFKPARVRKCLGNKLHPKNADVFLFDVRTRPVICFSDISWFGSLSPGAP
jgi:hypothetical protein